jgi:hypothetical protein
MEILIISAPISMQQLRDIARPGFGDMVKAVVDVGRKIMAVGGELHADEEVLLLENGSKQSDLWGINLYTEIEGNDFIEFDSMINLRPNQGNRTRGVDDASIRQTITDIVKELVQ